ncbi:hypothetical protein BDV93DRAFT_501353 [Ceratobasidium sp. AG-I]|nr:hypothetical protein BDV93DRAFT_501353 [Ceratobasidium sp. AG-I]
MPDGHALVPMGLTPFSAYKPKGFQFPDWVPRQAQLRPRQLVTLLFSFGVSSAVLLFWFWNGPERFSYLGRAGFTPDVENFDDIFLREAQLPQHNLSLAYPEGSDGRFVRFSNQVWRLGWNNVLQERLLNTILTYESNRAPVFSSFEAWAHPPRDDTTPSGDREVLVVPYTALLSGPTAGSPWPKGDSHPRAISQSWWEVVCPPSKRHILDGHQVMDKIGKDSDGIRLLTEWTKVVRDAPGGCLEITGTRAFDYLLIGSTRVLSLWDTFSKHPVVLGLGESDVVADAVSRNLHKLQSNSQFDRRPLSSKASDIIPGLVALHIRRGDYVEDKSANRGHCVLFARWESSFSGWSQLPQLPDKFVLPPRNGVELGQTSPELIDYYHQRCLPTPTQVASRLHSLKSEKRLTHVFIASNAEPSYLSELRSALASDEWAPDAIITSADLELGWRGVSVGVAVDMAIMTRAEVFIGNGLSSLTSNVVMRRLTTGRAVDSVRLW